MPWAQSPGFGGAAAVAAAVIAFFAARGQASVQRQAERKEQWWKRAEWALNLTLSQDSDIRTIGFHTLESLSTSEYADEHEGDVIAAATERSIDQALDPELGETDERTVATPDRENDNGYNTEEEHE